MNQAINLMPASYRQRLSDHRVRRRFVIHFLIMVIFMVAITLNGRSQYDRSLLDIKHLAHAVQLVEERRARAVEVNGDADLVLAEIVEYQRLALAVQISEVLATLGDLLPDDIVIRDLDLRVTEKKESKTVIEKLKEQAQRSRRRSLQDGSPQREKHCILAAEIKGMALSDVDIAALLGRLEAHPLFAQVQWDYARSSNYQGTHVREFRVSFEIDLRNRYQPMTTQVTEEGP